MLSTEGQGNPSTPQRASTVLNQDRVINPHQILHNTDFHRVPVIPLFVWHSWTLYHLISLWPFECFKHICRKINFMFRQLHNNGGETITYSHYVSQMWPRATIEELSSIFACVFGSVKTCIFNFLFSLIGERHWARWAAHCVGCNLRLAAAIFCFRNNFGFCTAGLWSACYQRDNIPRSWKTCQALRCSTFTARWPSPLPAAFLFINTGVSGKTSVWDHKLQEDVSSRLVAVWMEKQNLTRTHGAKRNCVWVMTLLITRAVGAALYTWLCEETLEITPVF